MDPLSVTTSLVSIVSCVYTITLLSREWARRVEYAKELSGVHQREIEVLERVIQECVEIANSATATPRSIEHAFLTCISRRDSLQKLLVANGKGESGASWTFTQTVRLSVGKKDIKRRYGMFRESVLLLRDLCSELRTQQQLVDMGAGMARLASDFLYEDPETGDAEHTHPTPTTTSTTKSRPRLINALEQLGRSNYVIRATVIVEQSSQHGGQRFKYLPIDAIHTPALVKLDTGSDVDVVSQEFLTQAGFPKSAIVPILGDAKHTLISIEGTSYQLASTISLFWFREDEQQIRKNMFYVVEGAPVDLLLGSKRFAPEVAKRVALWAGPPKSEAVRQVEQQAEDQRIRDADDAEAKELAKLKEERRKKARVTNVVPDLEKGSTTSAST